MTENASAKETDLITAGDSIPAKAKNGEASAQERLANQPSPSGRRNPDLTRGKMVQVVLYQLCQCLARLSPSAANVSILTARILNEANSAATKKPFNILAPRSPPFSDQHRGGPLPARLRRQAASPRESKMREVSLPTDAQPCIRNLTSLKLPARLGYARDQPLRASSEK